MKGLGVYNMREERAFGIGECLPRGIVDGV